MTEEIKYFVVTTREVHCQGWLIDATTKEEAIEIISNAEGMILDETFEYSHTLDPDTWDVREAKPDEFDQDTKDDIRTWRK